MVSICFREGNDVYFVCEINANPPVKLVKWMHQVSFYFFLYLPIYIMTYLSFYQFIYQHNYQHICLSVYIFTSLYIYLSIYLSIFIYLFLPTLLFIYFANLYILLFFHSSSTFSPKSKIYRLVCFNLIILYAQLYCI